MTKDDNLRNLTNDLDAAARIRNHNVNVVAQLAGEQLDADGNWSPWMQTTPRRLTDRQRDLMRYMRFRGGVTTRDARRFYADAGGALRRLEVLGLVKRRGHGGWEAT